MNKTLYPISENISWFSALKHSWRAALTFDRSQVTAIPAIRSTIVYVLPLALGVATHHVVEGVSIAGGAALLGAIRLASPYKARIHTLLLACVGIALSAFVGSLTGQIGWLSVLLAGIWGIGAGLLVALDQSASITGLQSALALIILSHFALTPLQALLQAALMFAGALLQTLVTMIPSPWQRTGPERLVLANLYQTLSHYALDPIDEQSSERIRNALSKAYSTLSDSQRESYQGKLFFELLEDAEHIRLSLIVLTRLQQQLVQKTTTQTSDVTSVYQLLQTTADQLDAIAAMLKRIPVRIHFGKMSQPDKHLQQMKDILKALRGREMEFHRDEAIQQLVTYGNALRGQLQKVSSIVTEREQSLRKPSIHIRIPRPRQLQIHDTVEILRANLTLRSTAFRHAIRLGIALALATALYRIFPLPIQRGYWIALTALLILKPDFTTTFTRGIARAPGTMLGAILTTLLVTTLKPSNDMLVLLDAITAYIAFSILLANYALFSVFITIEVVFLLTFVIPQPLDTTAYRTIDTAIGSVLALLIYALWPTWERTQTPHFLEVRLHAVQRYTIAVLRAYADPAAFNIHMLDALLKEARLARSNAEASIQRSLQEPEPHRINKDVAWGLLGAMNVLVRSALVLEAYLIDNPSHALPALTQFEEKVDEALNILATAIHERQKVTPLPDLQKAFRIIDSISRPDTQQEGTTNLSVVRAEAKQIIRTIHTMYDLLSSEKLQKEL